MNPHLHLGMWVTADGRIRQELLPTGRYEEERDGRKRAYVGRYTVTRAHRLLRRPRVHRHR